MIFNPNTMPQSGGGAVCGSYTGNGQYQKNLNLGFEPAAILIMSSPDGGGNVCMLVAVNGASKGFGFSSYSTTTYRVSVSFSGEGILMGLSTDYNISYFNTSGLAYHYVAFPKT